MAVTYAARRTTPPSRDRLRSTDCCSPPSIRFTNPCGPLHEPGDRPMRNRPFTLLLAALALAALAGAAPLAGAQPSPTDASARLRAVLPPEVAERVLATIADARSRE